MLNCAVWAILLFVASCLVADDARTVRSLCSIFSCNHLIAGAVSVFIILINFHFPFHLKNMFDMNENLIKSTAAAGEIFSNHLWGEILYIFFRGESLSFGKLKITSLRKIIIIIIINKIPIYPIFYTNSFKKNRSNFLSREILRLIQNSRKFLRTE